MLKGAIICRDQELADRLSAALQSSRRVGITRRLESYPNAADLGRFLRATNPQIVFLSMEGRSEALELAKQIDAQAHGTAVVAINRTCDPQTLLETMRAGIREFLYPPFEAAALSDMLNRLEEMLQQRPPTVESTDAVYAFLPAKAGSGTTTIAVNTAIALSKIADSQILLADLDLNCGLIGFMLLLESQYSITDAAENSMEMDENLWAKIVCKAGMLDVLPAGRLSPGYRIEPTQIRHILDYGRRNYAAVCLDLSGMMEKYSVEVLHEAKRIFLVCTPELPAMHLAREKLSYLRQNDLDSKVSILLNRAQKRTQLSTEEMEKLFGLPVHMSFPNDYNGVHKALTAGKQVDPSSELGRKYRELAETLVTSKTPAAEKKRGLLDLLPRKKQLETA